MISSNMRLVAVINGSLLRLRKAGGDKTDQSKIVATKLLVKSNI